MNSSLITKNQFGEQSNSLIIGGTSQLWCRFKVDTTNVNGLGISGLTSNGISNIFMHTSSTPATGNPNPAVGFILAQFAANHAGYQSSSFQLESPNSGSNINVTSGLTLGGVYVITSVGTTTPAQWQTLGLAAGLTPTVGQSFVAVTSSAGSGTGVVQVPATAGSGIHEIEVIGDPNQLLTPTTPGSLMLLQCLAPTSSSVTTAIPTAPAAGTNIILTFNMLRSAKPLI